MSQTRGTVKMSTELISLPLSAHFPLLFASSCASQRQKRPQFVVKIPWRLSGERTCRLTRSIAIGTSISPFLSPCRRLFRNFRSSFAIVGHDPTSRAPLFFCTRPRPTASERQFRHAIQRVPRLVLPPLPRCSCARMAPHGCHNVPTP